MTSFPSLPGQAGGSISEGFVYWRVRGGLEEHNGFDEDEPGEQGSKQVCISDPQKSGDAVITSGLRNLLPTVQQKTFVNFTVLWLFMKVFFVKFGSVASTKIVFFTNSRKFSPSKVSHCVVSLLQHMATLYMYPTYTALQFDWLHWDSSASCRILMGPQLLWDEVWIPVCCVP